MRRFFLSFFLFLLLWLVCKRLPKIKESKTTNDRINGRRHRRWREKGRERERTEKKWKKLFYLFRDRLFLSIFVVFFFSFSAFFFYYFSSCAVLCDVCAAMFGILIGKIVIVGERKEPIERRASVWGLLTVRKKQRENVCAIKSFHIAAVRWREPSVTLYVFVNGAASKSEPSRNENSTTDVRIDILLLNTKSTFAPSYSVHCFHRWRAHLLMLLMPFNVNHPSARHGQINHECDSERGREKWERKKNSIEREQPKWIIEAKKKMMRAIVSLLFWLQQTRNDKCHSLLN